MKIEIPFKTVDILIDCNTTAEAIYKNHNARAATSLKIEISLIIANIPANCNVAKIAVVKLNLFHLIFRSVFIFLLIKMIRGK